MRKSSSPRIIGELLNHAFARARRAWTRQDFNLYRELASHQVDLGAEYLNLNLGGTLRFPLDHAEILERLPEIIGTLQEATPTPLAFDSADLEFQRVALAHYDRARSPAPIVNSLAGSRTNLNGWFELIERYRPKVIIMLADRSLEATGANRYSTPAEALETCRTLFRKLRQLGLEADDIFLDPGLGVHGHDPDGLIPRCLELLRLIQQTPELMGTHRSVGLSNLVACTPVHERAAISRGFIARAAPLGLDWILANPEQDYTL